MFITKQQRPSIEFSPDDGQTKPTLVHYFSDRAEPFKSVLPQLIEGAGGDQERVFIVASPLSELVDETIRIHREPGWPDHVVVDEQHRPFFDAVKVSLLQALAKLEQIQFVDLDEGEDGDADAMA
jgi:hypothetical protein